MSMVSEDGVVLLIGSGRRAYREYLFKGLAERAPLWLIDQEMATWQSPYIVGSSAVSLVDPARMVPDEAGLLAAATEIARLRPVLGVCTYDEAFVIAAARVAERLRLPGLTVAGAQRCRDKYMTREALTHAGLPQPGYALVRTVGQAEKGAQYLGLPVVIKPRGMGASAGVVMVSDVGQMDEAFAVASRASHAGPPAFDEGLLVEEMVQGPEISVDGAIVAGEYSPFCLARKRLGPAPYFEEIGHIVDAADPLLGDAWLRHVLAAAHRALGLVDGITHTEVRLTARGPVIIEVNARLGGDLIPYIGQLATGVDPGHVAADVARGNSPCLVASRRQVSGIRFLYPPVDCRVVRVSLPEAGTPPGLICAQPMVVPGEAVYLPPRAHLGRYAFLIACTSKPATCEESLDEAASRSGVELEPLSEEELVPAHLL
jgi:ATP-grasp domain/ATP-grasp N-terminal domain